MAMNPSKPSAWLAASRLPTLWAAVSPVVVGSACAWRVGCFDRNVAVACLLGAMFIQLGTNYANDLFDFKKGADRPDRLGPPRAVAAGWLTQKEMALGAIIAFLSATAFGVFLWSQAGVLVVVVGTVSIAAGVLYTGGPYPLAYSGLGDLFVIAFFGFVAVCATALFQCGHVPPTAWLSSVAVGGLGAAILAVNNLRDREGDRRAGKKTLVVRFGEDFGRAEVIALIGVAYAVLATLAVYGYTGALLGLVSLPLAWLVVRKAALADGTALNPVLGEVARLQVVFSLLLGAGLVWL